jgi:DNA-binding transcriptional regulator YiaG
MGDEQRERPAMRGCKAPTHISDDDVRRIRKCHANGMSTSKLADWFGISQSAASNIVTGKRRADVK